MIGETRRDDRLRVKEFVIGVELAETTIAYPFGAMNSTPVLNDTPAGAPLLVVFDPASAASAVFDRTVAGQVLTFAAATPLTLTDAETGTTWDRFSGLAREGPLAGKQLDRVKSTTSFWFGWKDIHPDTLLYEAGSAS